MEGAWTDYLPGERPLCELLQISRPTLRRALQLLTAEGLVAIQQGKRCKILRRSNRVSRAPKHLVALIMSEPMSHLSPATFEGIAEMRQHLARSGFTTEILVCHSRNPRSQVRTIENFLTQNAVFCSVLVSMGQAVQYWFAQQGGPTLVLGSCHPSVSLPSLDVDYRAVCRHAAGHLLSNGHRRIALVVPDTGVAGDLASERGFCEALEQVGEAIVLRHNGTARGITMRLDTLFNSATPPTALIVAKTLHVFIVIIYLLKRGLAVPDTVSLISRDQDYSFERVSPPITHYAYDHQHYARRMTRMIMQLAGPSELPHEPSLIFPRLIKGGTVRDRTAVESSRS